MANKRTAKTKKEIKQAFIELLSKKSIHKITVSEIVELAEVSRATFYLHFEDVYRVYDTIVQDILEDLRARFENTKKENSRETLINRLRSSTNYISKNKLLFYNMMQNGDMLSKLHSGAVYIFLKEFYPKEQTTYGQIEVNFVAWGLIGAINDWIRNPNGVSEEQFNTIFMHILARFIPEAQLE